MSPRPNTQRAVVYDAADYSRNLRETFMDRPAEKRVLLDFTWPDVLQHVGDSLAVGYASDKWKKKGDYELYKHLAEDPQGAPNKVFCAPGFIVHYDSPQSRVRTIGPMVDFRKVPMPKEFAYLALFEESNLRLFTGGTDTNPKFGPKKDDGCIKVTVANAMLGASKICWSQVSDREDQPFLFLYTETDGVLMVIVGSELAVERDGIVG
jgi:hypothetical protein